MTTKRNNSSAENYLENLAGPLTLVSLIESIREGEAWTKRKMSEMLAVSPTYYSDFIGGNKPVSPQKAAEWADNLGYDSMQFVELAIQDLLERNNIPYKVKLMA